MEEVQQLPANTATSVKWRVGDGTCHTLGDNCTQGTSITYCSTSEDYGTPNPITITAGDGSSFDEEDGIAWSNEGLVSVDQMSSCDAFSDVANPFGPYSCTVCFIEGW